MRTDKQHDQPSGQHQHPQLVPDAHLLRLLYETMNDGVVGFDAQGRILFCNPAMAQLVGCRQEELLGKTAQEAWGGEPIELPTKPLRREVPSGFAVPTEPFALSLRAVSFYEPPHPCKWPSIATSPGGARSNAR
ncbi:MAG: hypothetical protein KatS3mg130_1891 [Candidatus Sumerlaea sp.]|nr:MAG: hypothetical protein KatS3mg130_1891 [Candidatus Sumerlaea sp.]